MARPILAFAGAAIAAALACEPASAETDLFSRHAFSGLVDLRAASTDGQPSFLEGGYGRTRFGGGAAGDFKGHAALADLALTWQPQITWAVGGVLDMEYQQG